MNGIKDIYRKSQSGFTLLELVVAMGVSSLILSAAAATLYQVWNNNLKNTTHLMAVKQIENATHFLLRDGQMAQTITISGTPEELTLSWVDWDDAETNTVTYSYDPGQEILTRTQSSDNVTNTVAYSVDKDSPPDFEYDADTNTLTIDITCKIKDARESRRIEIKPRPGL